MLTTGVRALATFELAGRRATLMQSRDERKQADRKLQKTGILSIFIQ